MVTAESKGSESNSSRGAERATVRAVHELTLLARTDVGSADVAKIKALLESVTRVRGWLAAFESRAIARSDELAAQGQGSGGRESLVTGGRTSGRQAGRLASRAQTLEAAPRLGEALASGEIGADHVDAVTRAVASLAEDRKELFLHDGGVIDAARRMSPDPFNTYLKNKARQLSDDGLATLARQKAATQLQKWVRPDGMHVLNSELDPETGAKLFAAIDAEVETLAQRNSAAKNRHTSALALAALVDRGLGAGPNTCPAEVIVVDIDTLTNGVDDHSVCETSSGVDLPPETVRRITCEAVLFPTIIRSSDGVVLDAGREARVANRAQRRVLRAMYPTCAFLSCTVQFDWCQIHHIVPWEARGPTDLDNLLPLCSRHHHLAHEGRWTLRLEADRTLVIHQPDGRPHTRAPLPAAALARGLEKRRAEQRTANTNNAARAGPTNDQ